MSKALVQRPAPDFSTEILAFNEKLAEFASLNTEVLAVSCDSEYSHLAWANTKRDEGGLGPNLKLKLVADKSMKIARDYGVLLEDAGVALRGLFLIDPKGTLRQITINDLPVGRSVDETLRLIKAFQFTDEHGEVATIKTDPTAKLEYFSKANVAKRATEEEEVNGVSKKARVE
ncbi:hypothetical protein P7C70_g7712, partial [Phenoliferia sp. Uapishka_3]